MKNRFMENEPRRRIQKPVGIYVFAIAVFIILGVLQFIRYFIEFQNANEDLPFTMVFIPLFLCVFTAASAIWVSFGDNLSRIILLVFVSLNVLWWAFLVIMAVAYDDSKNLAFLRFLPTLIRPLFIFVCCWWYFTKKEVVAYYKQNSELENE